MHGDATNLARFWWAQPAAPICLAAAKRCLTASLTPVSKCVTANGATVAANLGSLPQKSRAALTSVEGVRVVQGCAFERDFKEACVMKKLAKWLAEHDYVGTDDAALTIAQGANALHQRDRPIACCDRVGFQCRFDRRTSAWHCFDGRWPPARRAGRLACVRFAGTLRRTCRPIARLPSTGAT